MQVSYFERFCVSECPHCYELLVVERTTADLDIREKLYQHFARHPDCQQANDALPSFEEVRRAFHAGHDCDNGLCECACGCSADRGCSQVFGPYCGPCIISMGRCEGDCAPTYEAEPDGEGG